MRCPVLTARTQSPPLVVCGLQFGPQIRRRARARISAHYVRKINAQWQAVVHTWRHPESLDEVPRIQRAARAHCRPRGRSRLQRGGFRRCALARQPPRLVAMAAHRLRPVHVLLCQPYGALRRGGTERAGMLFCGTLFCINCGDGPISYRQSPPSLPIASLVLWNPLLVLATSQASRFPATSFANAPNQSASLISDGLHRCGTTSLWPVILSPRSVS